MQTPLSVRALPRDLHALRSHQTPFFSPQAPPATAVAGPAAPPEKRREGPPDISFVQSREAAAAAKTYADKLAELSARRGGGPGVPAPPADPPAPAVSPSPPSVPADRPPLADVRQAAGAPPPPAPPPPPAAAATAPALIASVRPAPAGATVTLAAVAAAKAAAAAVASASSRAAAAGATGTQVAAAAVAAAAAVGGGGEGGCATPPRPPRPPVPANNAFATPQRMWRLAGSAPPSPGLTLRRPDPGPALPADPDGACAAFKAQADAADWADAANTRLVAQPAKAALPGTPSAAAAPPAPPTPLAPDEPVKLWCEEVPSEAGRSYRQFLAASLPALWRRARYGCVGLAPHRHLYEVLREGRPAHLYFDLEFVPSANPGLDGDGLVDALVSLLAADMQARWGVALDPRLHVLEADSSTPAKWSRHLAVRLPQGAAFRDGQAVGRYVSEVLSHAAADRLRVRKAEGGGGSAPTAAENDPSQWTWVVDTAVYTRNRHFRTLLASKFGRAAPLMPTPRFVCGPGGPGAAARPGAPGVTAAPPTGGGAPWTLRDLWLFSLASAVEPGTPLVDVGGREAWVDVGGGPPGSAARHGGGWRGLEEACALLERPRPAGAASSALASPSRAGLGFPARYALGYKYDPRDVGGGGGAFGGAPPPHHAPPAPDLGLVALVQATTPVVEALAASRAGGAPAYVRRATVCGLGGELIVFTLLGPGAHWCGRKGGAHKNNYTYWLANFAAGGLAQKCHDPDCAGWASEPVALPEVLARQAARFFGDSGSGEGMSMDGGL